MRKYFDFSQNKGSMIIPVVLLLGVFIGGVIVLKTKGIGAQILTEGKKIFVPVASDPDADPDNDGLKNWEEEIYKTDKRDPDTDKDGYLDGEEVLSGYDPTKPAPDDALEGTDTSVPRPQPKNLTEFLAKSIVEKISSGEIKPIENSDTAPDSVLLNNEEILNDTLIKIAEKAEEEFVLPIVPDSEIKISNTKTTKEQAIAYITKISQILGEDNEYSKLQKSEAEIIQDTIITKNYKEIETAINFYDTSIKNIKNIEVPKDFTELHKEQIAIFELTKKILEAIRNFEEDPATATAAANSYIKLKDITENFSNKLLEKINTYSEK